MEPDTFQRECMEAVVRRMDLRQRATSRISGPFLPLYMARLTTRIVPVSLIGRLEPFILKMAMRFDVVADYLDGLLDALMLAGQRRGALAGRGGGKWTLRAYACRNESESRARACGPGRSLVIVLPGADWRHGLDDGFDPGQRHWLCLGRIEVPPPASTGRIVGTAQFRELPDHQLGASIRSASARLIEAFMEDLPALRPQIESVRIGLENQLTTETSRFSTQAQDAAAAYALLSPEHVTVLAGDHDTDAVIAALSDAGCSAAAISIVEASPRLSRVMRHACPAAVVSREALAKLAESFGQQASKPSFSLGVVVIAGTNGRHLPRAVDAMRAFAARSTVDLIVPTASIAPDFMKAAFHLKLRFPFRFRCRHVRSHHFFRPLRGRDPQPSALLTQHRFTDLPGPVSEAARLGATVMADHFLLPFLATAAGLGEAFRLAKPSALVQVPGTTPVGQVAAGAARLAGVPSWQVQTLLTQRDGREYYPVADRIGTIDTFQADLQCEYFGAKVDAVYLAGYLELGTGIPASSAPTAPEDRNHVIFVSQPLPRLATHCAGIVAEALKTLPDLSCTIHSHPAENDEQVAAFAAIAARVPGGRMRWGGRGTPDDVISRARVTICLYSNLGIKAALLGRDVIVVAPQNVTYPVNFDEMGIALRADQPGTLARSLADILAGGPLSQDLARRRAKYLMRNPQLVAGDSAVAFAKLVLETP